MSGYLPLEHQLLEGDVWFRVFRVPSSSSQIH